MRRHLFDINLDKCPCYTDCYDGCPCEFESEFCGPKCEDLFEDEFVDCSTDARQLLGNCLAACAPFDAACEHECNVAFEAQIRGRNEKR